MPESTCIERILFEPWGLGDALIAAATLREAPQHMALACHSRWHPLLRDALADISPLRLLAVDLPYTSRQRQPGAMSACLWPVKSVLSIRGDVRDWWAAHRLFPRAAIRMTGWLEFVARRSSVIDLLYRARCLPINNHYRAWAELAGVPFDLLQSRYEGFPRSTQRPACIAIHIGAQWASKQYPLAAQLKERVERMGHRVKLLAGPSDVLAPGLSEAVVLRVANGDLVRELRAVDAVVANDSGPMHLAALLGCPTVLVARVASIEAWRPPGVRAVVSPRTPRGHRPERSYTSDAILDGWPPALTVAEAVDRLLQDTGGRPLRVRSDSTRELNTIRAGRITENSKNIFTSET